MRTYVEAEEIRLVYSGKNYFDVLDSIIAESRETLHLQTYIFETDATGFRIMESLRKAAQRGVRVFLMADAYASFPFPADVISDLQNAGVHARLFSPLLSSESVFIGRRMHHKVVVADRTVGLIGGINIADKYNTVENEDAWLDYAVLIRGSVCEYLHILCEQFYRKRNFRALSGWEKKIKTVPLSPDGMIRFRRNDWIRRKNEIHKSYLEAILRSERSITLVASYFLPGNNVRRLLRKARERGVEVRVVLAGKSDLSSVRLAEQYLYDYYLRYGIRVFEWTNSVMHGKAMIVDGKWATIGSYNLNFLSHYISIELNADISDRRFIAEFSAHLDDIMSNICNPVEIRPSGKYSNLFSRSLMWLAYSFFRILMYSTMLGKKHRRHLTRK